MNACANMLSSSHPIFFCDLLVLESSGRTLLLLARSQLSQAQQRTESTVGCKGMGARQCKAEAI